MCPSSHLVVVRQQPRTDSVVPFFVGKVGYVNPSEAKNGCSVPRTVLTPGGESGAIPKEMVVNLRAGYVSLSLDLSYSTSPPDWPFCALLHTASPERSQTLPKRRSTRHGRATTPRRPTATFSSTTTRSSKTSSSQRAGQATGSSFTRRSVQLVRALPASAPSGFHVLTLCLSLSPSPRPLPRPPPTNSHTALLVCLARFERRGRHEGRREGGSQGARRGGVVYS